MLNYSNGIILFVSIFIGNATIFELPLLPAWILIYLILTSVAQHRSGFIRLRYYLWPLIGLAIAYFLLVGDQYRPYDPYFWMWPIELLLLILCYARHINLKINPNKYDLFSIIFLQSIMVIGGVLYSDESGRANFIFGPNVLYRIYIFFGMYVILHPQTNKTLIYYSTLLAFIGVMATQSSGG